MKPEELELVDLDTKKTVKELLSLIDQEKKNGYPDKKKVRNLLEGIKRARYDIDYRNTYTGQDARFLVHTSMRTFRDDC